MDNEKLPLPNGKRSLEAINTENTQTQSNCYMKELTAAISKSNGSAAVIEETIPVDETEDALNLCISRQPISGEIQSTNSSDAMHLKYRDLQLEYEESLAISEKLKRDNATLRLELEAASSFSKATEIVKLREQNEKLTTEIDELRQDYANIQTEYDDLSNQLMDSLQEEETLRDKYSKLELEINALMKHQPLSNTIESSYSSAEPKEVTQCSESSEQLNESSEQLQLHIKRLTADNALLCAENKSLLESTEQTISEMRVEITKLSTELLDKSAFVEKSDLEESKVTNDSVETLTKTIECLEREKSQLKQELDVAVAEKTSCDERAESLEKQLAGIGSLYGEKQKLEDSMESSKSESERVLQELKKENNNLRLTLAEQRRRISSSNDIEDRFPGQKETFAELHRTEESERSVDHSQSEKDKVEKCIEKELDTMEALAGENLQLKNSLELEHEDELQLLRAEKDNLSLALEQQKRELLTVRESEETLRIQLETITQELLEANTSLRVLEPLQSENENFKKSFEKEREFIKTLLEEKQQLEHSIESIKSKYEDSLQTLQEEKNSLSLALEEQRQETTTLQSKEDTLRLKIETLTLELQETSAKLLVLEQLQSEHDKFVKALVLAKQENHELSHQIQKLEAAQRNAAADQDAAETQLLRLRAESVAAAQERQDLLIEQQRLETQIVDDHSTLQKQRQDFESSLAELELKSKSLQKANLRLQATNSNLGEQLQTVTRQVAECATLRRQLERLTGEHDELQRRSQESVAETEQCRRALEADVELHKERLAQSIKTGNSYRTLLDTKESTFKDDKLKLENTVSCLLLEKQTLEEKLYLNEVVAKKLQVELSALRLKADNAETTSRERHEIQQLKSTLIKMSSPCLERKNRRLRTHDERRSQSIQAISHKTELEALNGVADKMTPNGYC